MGKKKIFMVLGKIVLVIWMFFWWGFLAYRNLRLLEVYPSLFLSWQPNLAYIKFQEIAIAIIPLLVYVYMGHLFLKCFDIFLPPGAYVPLCFVLGLSIITFLGEICGIFGIFYGWAIVALSVATGVALIVSSSAHWIRPVKYSMGYADDRALRSAHRAVAKRAYYKTIIQPQGLSQTLFAFLFFGGIILTSLLIFYHSLLYPITYWDSFSYLGMARSLFLNHRFPLKVVAQMGIGTGSNYPQMYRLASAIPSVVAGFWSNYFAQVLTPATGIITLLLVYHIILRLSRVTLTALSLTLLFCIVPYGIRYFTLTSDYSLTVMFTAAFFYISMLYMETKLRSYLILSALIAAFACHINYLMPLLFVAWIILIYLVHNKVPMLSDQDDFAERLRDDERFQEIQEPEFTLKDDWDTIGELLKNAYFWRLLVLCLILIAPWYARNWVLTGNPVYPYFSSVFGGKNINTDVLESMQGEWLENGDGIDKATLFVLAKKVQNGQIPDDKRHLWIAREKDQGSIRFTLLAKIYSSFYYFVTSPGWSWLLAPLFLSLALPGAVIWSVQVLLKKFRGVKHLKSGRIIKDLTPFQSLILLSFFFLVCLFAYHYLMAGYYLYQIIPILIPLIFFAFVTVQCFSGNLSRGLFYVWCLLAFLMPGLPFALMNFKLPHDVIIDNKVEYPWQLSSFRRPGMAPEKFYSLCFGEDANMIDHVNSILPGQTILTHDNRYLLYDPSIKIIHLDDLEIQKAYSLNDDKKKLQILKELGIDYYLKIPMEEKHEIVKRLGLDQWEDRGYMNLYYEAGGNRLYYLKYNRLKSPEDQTDEPIFEIIIKGKK